MVRDSILLIGTLIFHLLCWLVVFTDKQGLLVLLLEYYVTSLFYFSPQYFLLKCEPSPPSPPRSSKESGSWRLLAVPKCLKLQSGSWLPEKSVAVWEQDFGWQDFSSKNFFHLASHVVIHSLRRPIVVGQSTSRSKAAHVLMYPWIGIRIRFFDSVIKVVVISNHQ